MADKFAARQCNRYTVVCTLPDFCYTPKKPSKGVPVPYMITAKLDTAVSVVKKTNFNDDKAFVFDQSKTPNCKGDAPGKGKGVKSNTILDECVPTNHSPSVRVEGKPLVREGDTFDMNKENTVGKLQTTDAGSQPHITDEGKIEEKEKSLWDETKDAIANKWEDVKYNATHFNDPDEGFNAFYREKLGEGVASWTTDSIGDAVQSGTDSYNALSQDDYKAAGAAAVGSVARLYPPTGKAIKAYEKGEDALSTAESLASGEVPSGGDKKKKPKKKTKDKNDGGKVVSKEEEANCGKLTTYGKSKKGALKDEFGQTGKFDRDHIPASSYMLEKARLMMQTDPRFANFKLNGCMEKAIVDNATVIIVPKGIHHLGETYGVGVKTAHNKGDFKKSPNEIANRDIETYQNALKKEKPFNKKGKPLTDKQKKKLKEANEACKKKIKKNLEKMKTKNYDEFLEDQIKNNKNCPHG